MKHILTEADRAKQAVHVHAGLKREIAVGRAHMWLAQNRMCFIPAEALPPLAPLP